jgi:hypothetical protein
MKKVILFSLVALGLLVQNSFAQSFSVAHDTSFAWTGGSVDVHQTMNNTSGGPLTISWKIIDHTLASGWTVDGVCDNHTCYPDNVLTNNATYDADEVAAGVPMDLKVTFNAGAGSITSTSWVTAKVWDKNMPLNSKNITFIATRAPTGVSTVVRADDNVILYPNPAKNDVNVIFDQNAGVKNIAIYNIIGKAMSIYKVNGNSAKMNLENIPSGIYFVRLFDGQGRIIATRKFTHQ